MWERDPSQTLRTAGHSPTKGLGPSLHTVVRRRAIVTAIRAGGVLDRYVLVSDSVSYIRDTFCRRQWTYGINRLQI